LPSLFIYGYFREVWKAGWHLDTEINAPMRNGPTGHSIVESRIESSELLLALVAFAIIFSIIGYLGSRAASHRIAS
jgi:hypothetical protein